MLAVLAEQSKFCRSSHSGALLSLHSGVPRLVFETPAFLLNGPEAVGQTWQLLQQAGTGDLTDRDVQSSTRPGWERPRAHTRTAQRTTTSRLPELPLAAGDFSSNGQVAGNAAERSKETWHTLPRCSPTRIWARTPPLDEDYPYLFPSCWITRSGIAIMLQKRTIILYQPLVLFPIMNYFTPLWPVSSALHGHGLHSG